MSAVLAGTGVACLVVGVAVQQRVAEPRPELPASTATSASPTATPAQARSTVPPPPPTTAPGVPASRPRSTGPVLAASAPTVLEIPAIGVRSDLLRLGITPDGVLEVPPRGPTYDQAGWYRYSPTPGALGPAVLAGHVDSAANGPSVFFRLGDLRPRDTVLVTRADGSVAVFAVDEVRRFRKTRFPSELVYGNTDHAALRLITCGGEFDDASGHYVDNIVVLASLVRGRPAP